MHKYTEKLNNKEIILLDGGMGTLIQKYNLGVDDYAGCEGLNEILNITHPEIIEEIHLKYLNAGAHAIETNSFGGSSIKLDEYGKREDTYKLNYAAAQIAKNAIKKAKKNTTCFIIGSMGPTGKLPSSTDPILGKITFDELTNVFYEQAVALIEGGVDVLLLETQHDILEVKAGIFGCNKAIEDTKKEVALQVQVTVDQYGKMLYGTDILAAYNIVRDLGIDAFGINCSTGPNEMEKTVQKLSEYAIHPISIIPNAGIPINENGKALYKMDPNAFSDSVLNFINDFQIQITGGCCGTTPGHINAVSKKIKNLKLTKNIKKQLLPAFASPITNLHTHKTPYIIGERINSQGSRKAKELMINDKYSDLIELAKSQQSQGADLLDICFAMTERRDEQEQVSYFAKQAAYTTTCPLTFDSTEANVIEAALKTYAGRPLINSINLEKDKIHSLLPIIKKFGVSTIALCINDSGMAKTTKQKVETAKGIYKIATNQYGLKPEQLLFDPLTFTLATGEEEYKNSAIATFEAIKIIKKELPGVQTILGVSNVSFGLTPDARKVLNLVYLNTAVSNGLDYAIFNAAHFHPLDQLDKKEVKLAEELILNKHDKALINYIEYFQNRTKDKGQKTKDPIKTTVKNLSIAEIIQDQIIERKRDRLIENLELALKKEIAENIINNTLLPAMKIVGEKMDAGEIILPFVLESAEIMKQAVTHLEQYLDKNSSTSKGTIVLATVYGDVHDIGKNLVKTITANNGYKVIDLGKQVPADLIIETAIKEKADAITLSALLVTTSKQMEIVVHKLHKKGLNIPVIIGGAAINEEFAQNIEKINDISYAGGVYYSKDAFSGLKILEKILNG